MFQLANTWKVVYSTKEPLDNFAESGSMIEIYLKYPDPRKRKIVILMTGLNNLGGGKQSPSHVISLYKKLLSSIKADEIYCVSLSPTIDEELNLKIKEVNDAIKKMVDERHYVDSWLLYNDKDSLSDGYHHTMSYDLRIINQIKKQRNNV